MSLRRRQHVRRAKGAEALAELLVREQGRERQFRRSIWTVEQRLHGPFSTGREEEYASRDSTFVVGFGMC